jgi:hypothetical protein
MSEQINDGGPALPTADAYHPSGQIAYGRKGMSLRDWFAGQALAGLLAGRFSTGDKAPNWANSSYAIADAMLKARGGAH